MLYLKKYITEDILLGVWTVEESIDELYSRLEQKDWLKILDQIAWDSRKKEILATRVLLKELLGEEKYIKYYKSGKPYLEDNSFQISISHTKGYVAIALSKEFVMGLDIEQQTGKILKVRDRIITVYDFIDPKNEQTHLLLHWSAKEAMFKYLDAEGVDFRRNLHVEPFTPQSSGVFSVSESKTANGQAFDAHYMVCPDFVLVCISQL